MYKIIFTIFYKNVLFFINKIIASNGGGVVRYDVLRSKNYFFYGITGFCVKNAKKIVLNAVRHSRSVKDNFASQDAFLLECNRLIKTFF